MQLNSILLQMSEAEATTLKDSFQGQITAEGQEANLVSVLGQVANFFAVVIPTSREAEYIASDDLKKNNFAMFSGVANGPDYKGVDFLTAWEAEYVKIYG